MVRSRITIGATPSRDGGLDLSAVRTGQGRVQGPNQVTVEFCHRIHIPSRFDVRAIEVVIGTDTPRMKLSKFACDKDNIGVTRVAETQSHFTVRSCAAPYSKPHRSKHFYCDVERGVIGTANRCAAFGRAAARSKPHGKCMKVSGVHRSGYAEEESDVLLPLCRRGLNPAGGVASVSLEGVIDRNGCAHLDDYVVLPRLGIHFQFHRQVARRRKCFARELNRRLKVTGEPAVRTEIVDILGNGNVIDRGLSHDSRLQNPKTRFFNDPKFIFLPWQTDFPTGAGGDSVYNGIAPIRVGPAAMRSKRE